MAIPAPVIPTGNAYTVNVACPGSPASALPPFSFAAAALLRRWKIPVRMHLSGDSPATNTLRARLNEVGGRPSAFSPAPSSTVPGEGFWKTTLIVVEATGPDANLFWADGRDDKKVDWDPLLVALTEDATPETLTVAQIAKPDLWIVSPKDSTQLGGEDAVAQRYAERGAGAVCVVSRDTVVWHTCTAVFGRSSGTRAVGSQVAQSSPETFSPDALGVFAAGVVTGLMRDLLSENLFDKTLLRADRECLEMRPLRLGVAIIDGLAAFAAASEGSPRGLSERAEAYTVALKGPPSRPWAHKGR